MTETLGKALSDQVVKEFESALLYKAMAANSASLGYSGAVNWFNLQAEEELLHGKKIFDYIIERGFKPSLVDLSMIKTEWKDIKEMLQDTLEHEQKITKSIGSILKLARDEMDFGTEIFLQWFITEQVEEEASVQELLDKLALLGSKDTGLYMFDSELGSRVPSATE